MAARTTTGRPTTSWNNQAAVPQAADFRPRPLDGAELAAYGALFAQPATTRQRLAVQEPPTQIELDLHSIQQALKQRDAAPNISTRRNAYGQSGPV